MKVGTTELLLILVVALVVFGPSKLPELGKLAGQAVGSFKKYLNTFEGEWNEETQQSQGKQGTVTPMEAAAPIGTGVPPIGAAATIGTDVPPMEAAAPIGVPPMEVAAPMGTASPAMTVPVKTAAPTSEKSESVQETAADAIKSATQDKDA